MAIWQQESLAEILRAISEERAECKTLKKKEEDLKAEVVEKEIEYDNELEKKRCELQALKDEKAKLRQRHQHFRRQEN